LESEKVKKVFSMKLTEFAIANPITFDIVVTRSPKSVWVLSFSNTFKSIQNETKSTPVTNKPTITNLAKRNSSDDINTSSRINPKLSKN
jgi:hypothetical protein